MKVDELHGTASGVALADENASVSSELVLSISTWKQGEVVANLDLSIKVKVAFVCGLSSYVDGAFEGRRSRCFGWKQVKTLE